jgi:hemerythrin-like domain-containing protein
MSEIDLALETRQALPDALRVLLAEYPRDAWEVDPQFSGLIRFWLDRHLMFRRLVGVMRDEAEKAIDRRIEDRVFGAHLARYGSMFVGELHGHHGIEDAHYFPVMKKLDSRVEKGFDILDRDHHALDAYLASFADAANAALRAVAEGRKARDPIAAFRADLARMEGFLDRHLVDEEELVVPVLLKYAPSGLV